LHWFVTSLSNHHFYTDEKHNSLLGQWKRIPPQLYLWQYDKDCRLLHCRSIDDALKIDDNYYDIIVVQDVVTKNLDKLDSRKEVLEFLKKLKKKTKKLYWFEPGEHFYFYFGSPEFWEMIDGVFKGSLFKKKYAYYIRDESLIFKYQWNYPPHYFDKIIPENKSLMIENYYDKIIPYSYSPSITDKPALTWLTKERIYDIAGNFQGNSGMRFATMKMLQKRLGNKYFYSFDYGKNGHSINRRHAKNILNPFLIKKFHIGRILFHLKYGKYFYPKPLYFHNLANTKCYLGLGHYASSLRTFDAMGAGCVLLNWNMEKFEVGISLIDGYNYISIGDREKMTKDNFHLKEEYSDSIAEKVKSILDDEKKTERDNKKSS